MGTRDPGCSLLLLSLQIQTLAPSAANLLGLCSCPRWEEEGRRGRELPTATVAQQEAQSQADGGVTGRQGLPKAALGHPLVSVPLRHTHAPVGTPHPHNMYTPMHIYNTHTHIHAHKKTHRHIHMYTYTHPHTMHTAVHTYTQKTTQAHTHSYVHTHTHTHVHIHIQKNTQAHTHTYTRKHPGSMDSCRPRETALQKPTHQREEENATRAESHRLPLLIPAPQPTLQVAGQAQHLL